MQSLQMRCPVPAHIGLSMTTIASAPIGLPSCFTTFISEIFSSSGQPASVHAEDARLERARLLPQTRGAASLCPGCGT